ncbi:MAG: Asp-tRNA(Asn)/Glu-tRNA(Gln) amidotransferase subunit GatB [Candidatus Kaiserbacteria bacterium]|nr:Asp-tRNA(Asn)/Glu-tRNA(Gln) amidotransferase subunit GatB [Candidatus Kaiserbacteria bacterium]
MVYRPTIGLEIHAELATKTKMFCDSANNPDETLPNVNVCPVCMAHPGTLPVINREAVQHVLRMGAAIGGVLADKSEFDRKSYFYPDIPKGYQISQYAYPLITGGSLAGVAVTRVHLEEDTARSIHTAGKSLVDFNRAGIPLMELVTEPVIHDAETAGRFARELQLLLRALGASEANLEKGEMRIEANISVSQDTRFNLKSESSKVEPCILGTKVEVKNLNSFRSVERAVAFEIERHVALIERGKKVMQETRGWNEAKQETFHQRFKEGSADYRYFPEPDLPKLFLSEIPEFSLETLRASLPELPWETRDRLIKKYGLKAEVAELFMQNVQLGEFFEKVVSGRTADFIKLAVNYITSDLVALLKEKEGEIFHDADNFIKLINMVVSNKISSRGAKDILARMVESEGDPETIAEELNLVQIHDTTALSELVDAVLSQEEKAVLEYRNGKQEALQYLIGKTMKKSGGAGNPEILRKLIERKIN